MDQQALQRVENIQAFKLIQRNNGCSWKYRGCQIDLGKEDTQGHLGDVNWKWVRGVGKWRNILKMSSGDK